VVSRPPAAAAIIPAGNRRISLGSKRDGVGHRAPHFRRMSLHSRNRTTLPHPPIVGIKSKKDTRRSELSRSG
jgi:hypothetical protein